MLFKKVVLILLIIALFMAACSTSENSLWGVNATPTPQGSLNFNPTVAANSTAYSTLTLTPSLTPLAVLPLPITSTPNGTVEIATPTLPPVNESGPMVAYHTQGGDTLEIVAKRFGVSPLEIISDVVLPPESSLLEPGTVLVIPDQINVETTGKEKIIPDTEVVFSPSAIDFNIDNYIIQQNGYLASYREYLKSTYWTTGAQAVQRVATDNSINPRILLALLQAESNWVKGQPNNFAQDDYPLGYLDFHYKGLFLQLSWAVQQLSLGYYGWRAGSLTELTFKDGSTLRLDPSLNAGSVAVLYFFSKLHNRAAWEKITAEFPALYAEMFGDAWMRDAQFTFFPKDLEQPALILPFEVGKVWSFSGGPHAAWERQGALAALDFAPASATQGCVQSDQWVLAPANGKVVRIDTGVVILDLDEDGNEQTGWVLLFLHIQKDGRVTLGTTLKTGDKIGHPSCEGGASTGTHFHFARKYNGEWMLADGPVPFNLDGWIAQNGPEPYKGYLIRDDKTITACACGSFETRIIREKKNE